MRPLLLFTALFLIGCRTNGSLDRQAERADLLLRQERYNEELIVAEDGLQAAQAGKDPQRVWRFRLLKADGLMGKRELPEVLKALADYGMPPAGTQWSSIRAHFLLLKGQASYILNRFDEARDLISRARTAAEEAGSRALVGEADLRAGTLLGIRGDFAGARHTCEQVLQMAQAQKDRSLEARAAGNYGFVLMSESRYDEAIPWFERSEKTATEIGAGDTAARARGNIGACYARLGDYDTARTCYETARAHFEAVGNLYELQAWTGNEGNLSLDNLDTIEAADRYARALSLARKIHNQAWASRWLLNLATTSIMTEDWEAADRYNKEGLALNRAANDTLYEPLSLNDAARIAVGRGRLSEAADLYHQALQGRSEDPTVALEAHTGLAGLSLRNGDPRTADEEFRIAIAAVDSRQAQLLKDEYKLSWLSSLILFYRQYADFLVAQGRLDEALRVAESSRSKVLASRGGAASELKPHSAAEYQQLSRASNATLLEYFFGVSNAYLWVITPDSIKCHTLPVRGTIRPLVERYSAVTLAGRNPLEVAGDTGVKLYDMLLAPARADAPNSSRLILVPDEDLYSLNFETLPDGDNSARYLIESTNIRIAPSLNYIADGAKTVQRGVGAKMLLIGDALPSAMFPKLRFAGEEIDSIASAMPGDPPTVLRNASATPDAYREARPAEFGFIHFAAHASMNSANPLDSAVILSGPPEKGRLLARSVVSLPLRAQLVTVSACRSAGARPYAGEGLVGFAWAFLKAGAANVIAGLWDVNDKSTTQLMAGVYKRIGSGMPAMDALREAKLDLIRQGGAYAKPFYWAPFQLYTARP
jgi:CHAT domain-containing protein